VVHLSRYIAILCSCSLTAFDTESLVIGGCDVWREGMSLDSSDELKIPSVVLLLGKADEADDVVEVAGAGGSGDCDVLDRLPPLRGLSSPENTDPDTTDPKPESV
jgi:hypothetical protein